MTLCCTRFRVALFLCLLAMVSGVSAQSAGNAEREIERFSDSAIAAYQAAAKQHAPSASTDVLVLMDEDEYVFDDQGRATHKQYLVYKVLTQKGADDWAEISVEWEPWREERPAIRARVAAAGDGAIHQLDQKTITDSPAESDDSRIYSDRRVVRAPLPAIAPGALIEQEHTSTERLPFFGAGTAHRVFFGRYVPVRRTRLVLDAPAGLPLHYELKLLPEIKPQRSEAKGRVRMVFDSGPREPLEDADSMLPSDMPAFPYIAFSTAGSWQHVAEEYAKIVESKIANAQVAPLVARLTAGKTSREQKAAAILQYLSREIRYTGIAFGDAAIVPRTPAETLKQKYGDCKDKAALLVAMLRAAQIPAHVALLNSGAREDISAALPGMGTFDHAIVYAPGTPDIWIDATDQYARLGQLPNSDQGRQALIARPGSKSLVRIPVNSSQDNLLLEKRRFHMAENGPARVVEISLPHGELESDYRSEYFDKENKQQRENLTGYVKHQYLAEKLDRFERSDPGDLSRPFELELEVTKAKRGITDLEVSVAAIRLESLFTRLPAELRQREQEEGAEEKGDDKPKQKRTADYQLPQAFATEWRYEIIPPLGFSPKELPKSMKMSLGPALLTAEFAADAQGVVRATLRFDTVKRRLTVAEANEMRDRIVAVQEAEPTYIYFEPTAQILFREGKLRESFAAYRKLIAEHPKEAVHHLQIAKALLEAGMGEAAREEARLATKLEPASALAQKTLGEILSHDLVGRKFRRGTDWAGAEAAYRAAMKLDVEDKAIVGNLAILLEYNHEGERYAAGANLKAAVDLYRQLKPEELAEIGLKNNLAFALVYAGDFEAAKKNVETLNPQPTAVLVAAEAALNGSQAGIKEARKRVAAEKELKETMKVAGEILMRLRRYPEAADLLQAGASGENASATVSLASMLRNTRPRESLRYGNDPSGLVMQAFKMFADDAITLEKMAAMESHNQRKVMARIDPEKLQKLLSAGRDLRAPLNRSGQSTDALLDIVMHLIETRQEGDDASGYRVTLRIPGVENRTMYVVKEQGSYKMLDSSEEPDAAGLEILDRVSANNLAGARVLLNWLREEQSLAGGDDPLAGGPFPRFWTRGKEGDAQQMKLAAAALLVQSKETASDGLPILEAALGMVKSDAEKLNVSAALLTGYLITESYDKALVIGEELAKWHPESRRLFLDRARALRALGRFQQADRLAEERLKRLPDDLDALRTMVENAIAREDYALARARNAKVVTTSKAEAHDFNVAAWFSLFDGKATNDDVEAAIKATRLKKDGAEILHTLGCLYAEIGKTREAREVLVQGMDLQHLDDPNESYWYAFGRIAEQFGEHQVAVANYARVKKPKKTLEIPGSTYRLAQTRLKALAAAPRTPEKATVAGKP
jgi:transglutaminase-like putative cysteine protease/tetratricopeptide (TPR) repeat protein